MTRSKPAAPTFARLAATGLLAFGLLAPSAALALGTLQVSNLAPEENDGRWKVAMTMKLPSAPSVPHVPMIFSFEHKVEYERQLNDKSGDKPVLVKRPLSNQQPINEDMDVGFADATGRAFPMTKFDFVIRRDHGFEAGEYTLTIKRSDDGATIGSPVAIKLIGDNTVVDRRAMVFGTGKEKDVRKVAADEMSTGKKKDDKDAKAEEKKAPEDAAKPEPAEAEGEKAAEAKGPPPVPPKQGGCGCRVAGTPEDGGGALALAVVAASVVVARRRRVR